MAYNAKAVANSFLDLASESKQSLTPMKLQKLVYFAHGWHLALYGEPLIVDPIEAWQFGPVVPSLYREFRSARSGAIVGRATDLDLDRFEIVEPKLPTDDVRTPKLLRQIWDSYGKLSAIQLSNLTHLPDGPWARARAVHGEDARNIPITDELIRAHFEDMKERNRANQAQGG